MTRGISDGVIHGRFTRTLIRRRSYWRESHESQDPRKKARAFFGRRRTRVTSSGQGRTQDGAYVRYATVPVGERQGRGEEALSFLIMLQDELNSDDE